MPSPADLLDQEVHHDACGEMAAIKEGKPSHEFLKEGLSSCDALDHRGGSHPEDGSGDGIGVATSMPREWIRNRVGTVEFGRLDFRYPDMGAAGMIFVSPQLPRERREAFFKLLEKDAPNSFHIRILGSEEAPFETSHLGEKARSTAPVPYYMYFEPLNYQEHEEGSYYRYEHDVYQLQQFIERRLEMMEERGELEAGAIRIQSLTPHTLVHKGMGNSSDLIKTWPALRDPDFKVTRYAIHRRFSTNTFPQWWLAQPFFMLLHNGEINTIIKNRRTARRLERTLQRTVRFSKILTQGGSDTADMDRVLQQRYFAFRNFYDAATALLASLETIIPPAYQSELSKVQDEFKTFMRFHRRHLGGGSFFGGPAFAIAYTRQTLAGIVDNGAFRPGLMVEKKWRDPRSNEHVRMAAFASEWGAVPGQHHNVLDARLFAPGDIVLATTRRGVLEILKPEQAREQILRETHGKKKTHMVRTMDHRVLTPAELPNLLDDREPLSPEELLRRQIQCGWTVEQERNLRHMAVVGKLKIGAMGTPYPMGALQSPPAAIYEMAQQLFAQVTNPPFDPIRESDKFNLTSRLGGRCYNTDVYSTQPIEQICLESPILTNHQMEQIKQQPQFAVATLSADISLSDIKTPEGLAGRLDEIGREAVQAALKGDRIIVISHRESRGNPDSLPLEMPLALGAVLKALNQFKQREHVSVVVEGDDIKEAHDIALLMSMGANAVNPALAEEMVSQGAEYLPDFAQEEVEMGDDGMRLAGVKVRRKDRDEHLIRTEGGEAVTLLHKALEGGLMKIMSKMGINDIDGYRSSGLFELVGAGDELAEYLGGLVPSRIGGHGLKNRVSHLLYREGAVDDKALPRLGRLPDAWTNRSRSKAHVGVSSAVIAPLKKLVNHEALKEIDVLSPDFDPETMSLDAFQAIFDSFSDLRKYFGFGEDAHEFQLRDLLRFKGLNRTMLESSDLRHEDVLMALEQILPRLKAGQMSFGALLNWPKEAIELGLNALGTYGGSGEGGVPDNLLATAFPKGLQMGSGRFGILAKTLAHPDVKEICIKVAQGAKPGEGGQLPGYKVWFQIAKNRHCEPGTELISPPPHHDVYSIEDLTQLIEDIRSINPRAKVSVKLVSGTGIGTIGAGVVKNSADIVEMDGYEGGTGARTEESRHAGLPSELGIRELHSTLARHDLRNLVTFRAMGGVKCAQDIMKYMALGADEVAMGTMAMVALDCNLQRNCHAGCGFQIAHPMSSAKKTFRNIVDAKSDPELYQELVRTGAKKVAFLYLALALEIAFSCRLLGIKRIEDLVGNIDLLERKPADQLSEAAQEIDTLYLTDVRDLDEQVISSQQLRQENRRDWDRSEHLQERQEWKLAEEYERRMQWPSESIKLNSATDRSFGARVSGIRIRREISSPLNISTEGSAGNSYAVWGSEGMHFIHRGTAEAGFAKGISEGCTVSLLRPNGLGHTDKLHIPLLFNNVGFGATGGRIFVDSITGQRCGIRLSGNTELFSRGGGEYAAEYMTGGQMVLLPDYRIAGTYDVVSGRFGAGMSGGEAFVFVNKDQDIYRHIDDNLEVFELDQDADILATFHQSLDRFGALGLSNDEIEHWKSQHSNSFGRVVCIRPKRKPDQA